MARDTYISDSTRFLNGVEYLTKEEFRRLFYFDALDPLKDIRQDRRGHSFIRHTCLACRKAYAVAVGTDPGEGNFCEECTWQLARDNASLPSLELGKVTPLNPDGVALTSVRCKRCWVQFWLPISSSDPKSSVVHCPSCTRVRDLIQQIEVPVLTHTFEKGPEREGKPWTPSEGAVKFGEQMIQQIGVSPSRDKHNDTHDSLAYIRNAVEHFGKMVTMRLLDAEVQAELYRRGLSISDFIIDDREYVRVVSRERLTLCKDQTSVGRTDWSWSYPSECMTTKPLPKMTRT